MVGSLLTEIQSRLKELLEHERIYVAVPRGESGTNPSLFLYPVGFFAVPIKLRQSDATYTICVAVEQTCTSQDALVGFWEYLDEVYNYFIKLEDHYILTDDGDYMVLSVNSRYYTTAESDVALAEVMVDLKRFNQ